MPQASFDNPPGLYGTESGFLALNLMGANDTLSAFELPAYEGSVYRSDYAGDSSLDLAPYLLAAALALLILDTLIVLFMAGAFALPGRKRHRLAAGAAMLLLCLAFAAQTFQPAVASDAKPGDADILAALDRTHLAYVLTGDARVDRTSSLGMSGLTRFLTYRTSLEPGDPIAVDLEADNLSLYFCLNLVDLRIPRDDVARKVDIILVQGRTSIQDHGFHDAAHAQYIGCQPVEFFSECRDNMIRHVPDPSQICR